MENDLNIKRKIETESDIEIASSNFALVSSRHSAFKLKFTFRFNLKPDVEATNNMNKSCKARGS